MQIKVKVSFESMSPSSCFNILQLPARKDTKLDLCSRLNKVPDFQAYGCRKLTLSLIPAFIASK